MTRGNLLKWRIAKEADAGHVHVPHTPLLEEQRQRRGVVQALQLAKKTEPFILDVVDVVQQTGAVPAWADEVAELVQEDDGEEHAHALDAGLDVGALADAEEQDEDDDDEQSGVHPHADAEEREKME